MKKDAKKVNVISIICSGLGLAFSAFGLIVGVLCIGADGWDALGVIFILPSLFALIIILFDLLIAMNKIKGGLIYSVISYLIKLGIILCFVPSTIYDYKQEIKYGVSNLDFDITIIVLIAIVAIPSLLNIIKLIKEKQKISKS